MGEVYCIGSGFYARKNHEYKQFIHKYWVENTLKYTDPKQIFVVVQDSEMKYPGTGPRFTYIHVPCNIGHVSEMLPFQLSGWAAAFFTGAMLAYSSGRDYIFKEQDCLAFGNWIHLLYGFANSSGKDFVFGNSRDFIIEQSLVFIRHRAIPLITKAYFEIPEPDNRLCFLPEDKFVMIEKALPQITGRLPFGFGRNRPWSPCSAFYIQQVMLPDLDVLEKEKLVTPQDRSQLNT